MTQALHSRLGGSPFGPAGTGKTESVKALGTMLGRFVLVFCCDENFDFQAMGRIFVGLCQVGAWGCFDEFNRLEERILSAVSQQIQSIQEGLGRHFKAVDNEKSSTIDKIHHTIDLLGKPISLNEKTGIKFYYSTSAWLILLINHIFYHDRHIHYNESRIRRSI